MVLASEALGDIETHPVDVLVIGAGGAGIRAAIEAKAAGATVGLVCKSLFGKAHTVMAEGGVAAALAHVDPEDKWQTHFRDTMVGGRIDCFSCTRARRARYTLWQRLTDLNRNHMWWAWTSLITVTLADVYVRALQAGVIVDPAWFIR